jgi:hypothetical protein
VVRLHRPYIPWTVRRQVILRQLRERGGLECFFGDTPDRRLVEFCLMVLFGSGVKTELQHRPALCNRVQKIRNGKTIYKPDANDPDYLVYLRKEDHDIETRVRGIGAQRSDLGQRRYLKRVAKSRKKREKKWKPMRAKRV